MVQEHNSSIESDQNASSRNGETEKSSKSVVQSKSSENSSQLSLWSKLGFALGHIYNDLSASLWFSYCLLFLSKVLQLSEIESGALILFGQVVDACATPILGYFMDRYGTKQKWHIFGSIIVFITIPLLWSTCPFCNVSWWQMIYLSIVILIFQIGWPAVQISHLAMIPEIARTQQNRNQLSLFKNSAQFVAYIISFIVTYFALRAGRGTTVEKTGPHDAYRFRNISLTIVLIGIFTTIIFQLTLTIGGLRKHLKTQSTEMNGIANELKQHPHKNFFKSCKMYQNSLLYIYSRVLSTLSSVYIPLWLNEVCGVELVALIPLVSYVVSFLSSLPMDHFIRWFGHRVIYLLGVLISIVGCILIELSSDNDPSRAIIYAIACCLGAGSSITMVCSLCSIADMIADHPDQSGLVYSTITTADKLIVGVMIMAIQMRDCKSHNCQSYYKDVLARVNGVTVVLAAITLGLFLLFQKRNAIYSFKKRVNERV